jgi:deoxyadenosine/deoxycytidine kinase
MFVAIAGNIGAGKSSLTKLLSERFALEPVYEAVDENPYLEDFYRDMRRYAFHSQMFFLAKRLEQHLKLVNPGNRIVQDRTLYEDANVFARNLFEEGIMDARDYASYCQMVAAVERALRPPDLLVYLRAGLPTLRRRIAQRGRAFELRIEDAYLERLNVLYERWFEAYALSDKLAIDGDALDFVGRPEDAGRLLALLEPYGLAEPILQNQD